VSALNEPTLAWEPLTPRGVAAFARASLERLLIVQGVFAALAAACVVWFFSDGIFPVIDSVIGQLPDRGEIRVGKLNWQEDSPVLLAENNLLAVGVNLEHDGTLRSPADFQLEFGKNSVLVFSLFGEGEVFYPSDFTFALNQRESRAAWGAWSPEILALVAIGTFFGLLLIWALLATLYFLPVWLISFFYNRDLNLLASWKLAAASLMPGALLMSTAIVLYELGAFDLVQFCFAAGLHLVIGWVYLFVGPVFLQRVLSAEKKNPFTGAVKD